jgi:hypothetical protein
MVYICGLVLAATALDAWIKFRATAATPVFVLLNAETPSSLHSVFASLKSQPGFVTVGSGSDAFTPDVVVAAAADAERRAYDALEHGGSLEALTRPNIDKPRTDEASIMRERTDGADNVPPDPLDRLLDNESEKPAPTPPPPLIDHTLQRAVHLHRALVALKRL